MSKGLCEENTFDILHKYSEKELADIIYEFGEESFSRKIAYKNKFKQFKIDGRSSTIFPHRKSKLFLIWEFQVYFF